MTDWREVTLSELCSRITVGHVGKMASEYVDDGVPFLRSQNIRPFVISTEGMLRISEEFHARLSKSELRAGDVAVVRTGYPGTAAVVPPELDGSNCADLVVVTPSDQLNADLLAALFNSTWGRATVSGQLVGSAQQHFNVGSAKAMRVRLPDRQGQDRIAAVIRSLNDLIENNRRRIGLLEQMAQAIYREWFVHFRYPGHEDDDWVDSDLGPVPEGWHADRLEVVAHVNRSSRKPRDDEEVRYLDISCLGDRQVGPVPEIRGTDAPGRARRVVASGDVVWSMVRPNRRAHALLVEPGENWIASTGLAVLTPTSLPASWLFETVSTRAFSDYLVSQEGGAAYPAVKPRDFNAAPVVVPPCGLAAQFDDAVGASHRLIWDLFQQSSAIEATRDLLLPKLVTGEIDVSDLDLDALVEQATA